MATLVDTSQVSKQTFSYDQFNNQTDAYEYDYGSGAPGALVRRAHTDYLTTNPVNGVGYTGTNIHLRSLATQTSIYDGGGTEKARTTYEFDNYANDTLHAPLMNRALISGLDAAFTTSYTTRGNATKVSRYLLPAGTAIPAYSQYDIAGNVVKTIDGRGYATTFEYDDRFGWPDGEARANNPPIELTSQSQTSYALVTKVTKAGHTAFSQYDFYTGRPVDGEDANAVVASGYYNDPLDRPTQVIRGANQLATTKNQTSFVYDDVGRTITTTSDRDALNDNLLKSVILYDGLGRTTETRQYEGGSNYIATKQNYDALGRTYQVSNPYRPWQSENPVWTTTGFDALSRVTSVTTPDSAAATTSYLGNAVTVTDQAGKARKSVADALGRLVQIYEDPSGLNYLTSYSYDVLDDLTTVSQGVQTRTFVYDSLKRLTSATNPESGTASYTYDNNGNILTKTDERSITTTMVYDALNRPTSKSHTNDPQSTSPVYFYYDNQALPAGAPAFDRGYATGTLVAVTYGSGSSAGTYRGYDALGRVIRQYQRTDSINYLVEASYFANSSLQSETYPSVPGYGDRRTVSYTNDSAGRLASLNSAATTYAPAASVSSIGYASHNALKTETYGNSLVHAVSYNNRLQSTEIKLGTSSNPTSVLSLTYNYGATTNNGNLQSVTYNGGGLSYTQTFGYDQLNRLTTSQENAGASWSQANSYDRYANRSVVGGGLSFDASNNRIIGYSYDSAGNLLNDGYHAYTYDAENRIVKVDSVTAYSYDGEGKRVRKLVGENTRFVYGIGGQLVAEYSGATGTLVKEYVYGGEMQATVEPTAISSNGTRYTTTDILGSPRLVTNASGGVVSRHDYKPFGEELFAGVGGRTAAMGFSVNDGNRQKFTGYERDNETGLDFAQARYYASTSGRFNSPDPLAASASAGNPQSWNRYAYVGNNPLTATDPTGMSRTPATGGLGQGGEFFGSMMHQINGLNSVYTGEQSWNLDWAGGTMDYGEYVSISMPQNSPIANSANSISENGVALIMKYERYERYPYNDPEYATIGYGHLLHYSKVNAQDRAAYPNGISREEAKKLLLDDIKTHTAFIDRYVKVPLTQNQYDALASYVFNVGPGHLKAVAKHLNSGDLAGAVERMGRPVTQKGVVMPGLVKRRTLEQALFSRP